MEGDEIAHISHSGLVARSPQGHAATSMPIKGNEEIWVEIQTHTFRNWYVYSKQIEETLYYYTTFLRLPIKNRVNDMLKETGFQVRDLSTDLCDGVRLVALIEVLQKRKLRNVLRPVNQHQMLENATTALNAITADGIKLVNIGTFIRDDDLYKLLWVVREWNIRTGGLHTQREINKIPPPPPLSLTHLIWRCLFFFFFSLSYIPSYLHASLGGQVMT